MDGIELKKYLESGCAEALDSPDSTYEQFKSQEVMNNAPRVLVE